MKALFVDDDVTYGDIFLKHMNEYCQKLELKLDCDVCNDLKAVWDRASDYDIFFLDVELGEINGLDLAEELRTRFIEKEIIFISFYESYVFQAFKVKPLAYIRKDKLKIDLYDALTLVKQCICEKCVQIDIRINRKTVLKITPTELVYCQSDGHYVQFVFKSRKTEVCRIKLNQVEDILAAYGFIRVHVSYLVNEACVDSVHANELKLIGGQRIIISRTYKQEVYRRIFDKQERDIYE